jgi:DNA ligase-1
VLYAPIARTSARVSETASRKAKVALIAEPLKLAGEGERAIVARHLAGETGHKLGASYATVAKAREVTPAADATLTVLEVERVFAAIAQRSGAGSTKARLADLGGLFARATAEEQGFLAALVIGELRQGALDAYVVEALALATQLPLQTVRSAYMLAGDLGVIAEAALGDGNLSGFGLTLFTPILPMLAQTADDTAAAIEALGEAAFELKLDGFRVQIHKDGERVRVYSRALNDVTSEVPEVVAATAQLPAQRVILDGEAIAFGPDGRPLPFQDTMRRQSKDGAEAALTLTIFDALLVDDQTLLAAPTRDRIAALGQLAPALAVPRIITADAEVADAFYRDMIGRGHEGVVAKALDAPYDAGSRGAAWLKIKQVHRLDLIVLAAEWGSGRRRGWLSNLHLGARDPSGGFVMLGKTFKGMTDEVLAWQTAELLAREVDRTDHVVHVRPELVAEVAFNDVQRSTRYPGGVALRLARLVRYRPEKLPSETNTIDEVRALAIGAGVL